MRSGLIRAEGRVVKLGRQTSYTEGFVHDGGGKLAVHATATFSMIGGAAADQSLPQDLLRRTETCSGPTELVS